MNYANLEPLRLPIKDNIQCGKGNLASNSNSFNLCEFSNNK